MDPIHIITQGAWAAIAAFGFALIFNVPKRTLGFGAFCGAVGVSARLCILGLWPELHIAMATLIAAIIVAGLSELFSRVLRSPSTVFSVPGVIPMVPGSFMFRAMVQLLQLFGHKDGQDPEQLALALQLGFTSLMILTALAVGTATPNLLLYRRRPEA
ncbi:MAG: threonine/serine exporter family protein [Puniceicoccales bacterium]